MHETPEITMDPLDLAPELAGGSVGRGAPARPDLLDDDESAEARREEAYDEDFFWAGQELAPFSIERYSIFVTQRNALAAPPLGEALRDGGAFYPDALRILWLCSVERSIAQGLRRYPEEMLDAIEAWAESHAPLHLAQQVLVLGIRIFNAAFANRHEARSLAASRQPSAAGN